ncbi:TetR family transcriptional regulator [Streptomyces sp. NPDC046716]|uniref:TetR family transcriptional regulator n=1 Tax=Streptomyces sp. NPDC046716 TaxID=3157093 RepID=UPI00340F8C4E
MSTRAESTLAERKRQLVADELTEAALQLLAIRGFDAVTVDEIVDSAGVSKRTFFRYFRSKEDVVVQFLAGMGDDMRTALVGRPADETPSEALLHTVRVPVTTCAADSERALRVVRLILRTPALLARFLERQDRWRDDLAAELARRTGRDPVADLYPALAAGAALTAFHVVLQRWSAGDGAQDPVSLLDEAFAVVAPTLDLASPAPAHRSRTGARRPSVEP